MHVNEVNMSAIFLIHPDPISKPIFFDVPPRAKEKEQNKTHATWLPITTSHPLLGSAPKCRIQSMTSPVAARLYSVLQQNLWLKKRMRKKKIFTNLSSHFPKPGSLSHQFWHYLTPIQNGSSPQSSTGSDTPSHVWYPNASKSSRYISDTMAATCGV